MAETNDHELTGKYDGVVVAGIMGTCLTILALQDPQMGKIPTICETRIERTAPVLANDPRWTCVEVVVTP